MERSESTNFTDHKIHEHKVIDEGTNCPARDVLSVDNIAIRLMLDALGTHAWLSHRSIRDRDRQVGGVHGGRCRWNCPLPPQPRRSTRFRYVASDRGRRSFGVRAADTEFAVTPANHASLAARLRRRSLKKAKPVKRITRRYNGRPIRAPPITATASVPHLSLCAPQYP
ncbi:hypothetical protein B296_00012212 [Ensete ventricosum]|uniref:Uncharacterized protein n=1 Tax=Ensete ventricosum TaxID=4639 RepID=A0A426ZHT3_ENSVE|nr:hypothetical protein B296_00012212 [Ensete ventricosum]